MTQETTKILCCFFHFFYAIICIQVLQSILAENGDLRKYVEGFHQNVSMPVFMAFLNQGKKEGYLKENISMESILVYYQLLKTAIEKHYEVFTGEKGEQLVDEITHLFFYGLLKERIKRKKTADYS
ncbi:hypothetical protein [Alkalihalobacillus deserti]|uniref:hypothetical protein n=1 Tax=Alkalihalobacillus deserti TaxID=2879466 RepID=UPI001D142532|nr:hypothetical protein [Alkalihalobacillus deserti]